MQSKRRFHAINGIKFRCQSSFAMETLGLIEAQCWEAEVGSLSITFDCQRHFSRFVRTVSRWRSPRLVANVLGVFMAVLSPILTMPLEIFSLDVLMSPAIAQSTCAGTLLRRGDQGNAVKSLQSDLAARKYSLSVDGDFGGETERILKLFQTSNRLDPDGVYGEQTCKALTSFSSPAKPSNPTQQQGAASPKPAAPAANSSTNTISSNNSTSNNSNSNLLRLGDQGNAVRYLQEKLRIIGYQIPVTGVFDDATNRAVKDFQAKKKLNPDGVVGSRTNAALEQAILGGEKYAIAQNPTPNPTPAPNLPNVARGNSRLRYIVAVPLRPDVTLKYVQKYAPNAVLADARYGDYVQAGRYASVESAESISYALRSYGLDARIITD
jgi:peptidoglycan hydrolase-like protein with peptidoglycan-binding domain